MAVYTLTFLTLTANAAALSLEEFKSKAQVAQQHIDQGQNPKKALEAFKLLRGTLPGNEANLPYIVGLEISILWAASVARDEAEKSTQIESLLKKPNTPFIAMEKYKVQNGIAWRYWYEGFTHPQVISEFKIPELAKHAKTRQEKVRLYQSAAVELHPFKYGRLESSWGMSYGDSMVEAIYFDKELSDSEKTQALSQIEPKLKGSALGNLQYCLAILMGNAGKLDVKKKYAQSCIKTYSELGTDTHHSRSMRKLCEKALTAGR